MSWGTPKAPQCGGIPLDEIAGVDWNQVNLDEWLGILQANGQFAAPSSINLDTLTGAGSAFDVDGTRLNAEERAHSRMDGADLDKIRKNAANSLLPDVGAGK